MEAKQKKQMDLLTAIEQIVEKAKDSKLSPEFYRKASRYIKYVSDKLDLTKEQSVMLALFINQSDDDSIRLYQLSNYVQCPTIRILRYKNEINELEKRELIRCYRNARGCCKSISYRVPFDVIDALNRNEKFTPRNCTGLTCQELFGELEDIFELRKDKEMTYEAMVKRINSLFSDNSHLRFVKSVNGCFSNEEEDESNKMLLVLFCHLCVNNGDDNIGYYDLDFLYDDKREWNRQKNELSRGDHFLLLNDIIEYNNDNGMVDRDSYRVTRKYKEEELNEVALNRRNKNKSNSAFIHSDKIVEKQLFYGQSIQSQIDELGGLLDEGHYQEITSRMKKAGFRCGFTCLFYGAPGTGKTETVLQIARQTGRNIMQIDIAGLRDKFVGETEKNVKAIFTRYKHLCKYSDVMPILFFNEADAIFNKRTTVGGINPTVEKMENSMQHIILQEVENLEGILIATTNLTCNLDDAFERRFLFKVESKKPEADVKAKIWTAMLNNISEEEAHILAERYDFSGGQIENIARKRAIDYVLNGKFATLQELETYCKAEMLDKKGSRARIGFNV